MLKGCNLAAALISSLPSRECGLKSGMAVIDSDEEASLPSRECGLKSGLGTKEYVELEVTPFAGVWNEIEM